jgi:hemerythrin-like metal-binding protein
MKNILYIVWSENSNLGIRIIDEQHRGIISTINSLYYFVLIGYGNEMVPSILAMIEQYIHIHFKTEEGLLKEAGYPAIGDHIALHKELTEKTKFLTIEARRTKDPDVVLKFLKDWWLNHINTEDRKYVPFVSKLVDKR